MTPRSLPSLAALLFLAAAPAGRRADEVELRWTPEEGLVLSRSFESWGMHSLESETIYVQDDPVQSAEWTLVADSLERIVVTDEVLGVEDGRVTSLRRTFDELEHEVTYTLEDEDEEEKEIEEVSESDLEGATVEFAWDDDEEAYLPSSDELDDEVLEGLVEDMDFRLVLPDGPVAEGDSWDVDPEAYLVVMWPGGLVRFRGEDEDEVDAFELELDRRLIDSLEGDGTATLEGVEERDGGSVAVVALELEVDCEAEAEGEDEEGGEFTRRVTIHREVEGRLYWDLERGHLQGAELEAESEMRFATTRELEAPDGELVDVTQEQTFTGTIEYDVTVTEDA